LTFPNKLIPRIEYSKMRRNSKHPMFASDGIVTIRVVKIPLRLLAYLMSLNILPILNILTIVTYAPTLVSTVKARMI
jgi:hypothetical protein